MRSNLKHITEELERYIHFYLKEGKSFRELRRDFGLLLSESTFSQKVLRYQEYGLSGIEAKPKIIITVNNSRKQLSKNT